MKKNAATSTNIEEDRGDEIDVFQSITNHIMKKKTSSYKSSEIYSRLCKI